jgi:N-terminal region of glycosyl transferase group 7/N-terminal domain of galactosyltransferase
VIDAAPRLKIVVPYRDRERQLRQFLPHIRNYFAKRGIPYHIVIAEQAEGLPFNRGAVKNAGFRLGEESDYTCFHDVDYLPLEADYGWADFPAGLVWAGAESVPIKASGQTHYIKPDMPKFFGGAVLMPNMLFEQVDGYSNQYWGWGYEDTDLISRFQAANITCVRRRGSFRPLIHDSEGYEADGNLNEAGARNRALYLDKWRVSAPRQADGLSTLTYEILSRQTLVEPVNEQGGCEKFTLLLSPPDGPSQ